MAYLREFYVSLKSAISIQKLESLKNFYKKWILKITILENFYLHIQIIYYIKHCNYYFSFTKHRMEND